MKSKIKSFFKGVLVIFMVLLFFGEDKSGDYNEIADLIKGEKIEQAENLLNKSSYSKMDYSDEDGKKKMELNDDLVRCPQYLLHHCDFLLLFYINM